MVRIAWSWTAYAVLASRQRRIRAAFSSACFMFIPNSDPYCEHENHVTVIFRALRLGYWRREAARFQRRVAVAGGSSGATEPRPNGSATRLRYLKAGTSARGVERAAGASGCGRGTKRVLVPADSGPAGISLVSHLTILVCHSIRCGAPTSAFSRRMCRDNSVHFQFPSHFQIGDASHPVGKPAMFNGISG